jgi:hypothetical protein
MHMTERQAYKTEYRKHTPEEMCMCKLYAHDRETGEAI